MLSIGTNFNDLERL